MICRDAEGPPSGQQLESGFHVRRDGRISVTMKAGGGFVAKLSRQTKYTE